MILAYDITQMLKHLICLVGYYVSCVLSTVDLEIFRGGFIFDKIASPGRVEDQKPGRNHLLSLTQ